MQQKHVLHGICLESIQVKHFDKHCMLIVVHETSFGFAVVVFIHLS